MADVTEFMGTVEWRGREIETLHDIVDSNLHVLFVGLNPSPVSVAKGHYHQGRLGQQFWKLLVHHGVLPQPQPGRFHDELLLERGLGITDLVKAPSARANSITNEDVKYGQLILLEKIEALRPAAICSVYKGAIEPLYPGSLENCWGLQEQKIGGAQVFVLPFPYRSAALVERHMPNLDALAKGAPSA